MKALGCIAKDTAGGAGALATLRQSPEPARRQLAQHFVFTDRRSIEARPAQKRAIFLCDCFARFAVVLRHLSRDYETLPHSKA